MVKLSIATVSLVATLATIIFVVRIVSSAGESTAVAALRKLHCAASQPCWNNIYLGETSLAQAKAILRMNEGFEIVEDTSYTKIVYSISV